MSIVYSCMNAVDARFAYDELYRLYIDVYRGTNNPFYDEERVHDQLRSHFAAPGLDMVTARDGGEVVGYMYGFPRQPNAPWWQNVVPLSDVDLTHHAAVSTFAVCELMVAEKHRGMGIGRRLHHRLMGGRDDGNGTLLVLPDNDRARGTYKRWGWRQIGHYRPSAWKDAPTFEAMLLPLPYNSP